jgi:hypothetical protein
VSEQPPTSQPTKRPPRDRWDRVRVWLVMVMVLAAAAVAIVGTVVDHPTTCAHTPRWTSC